MIVIPMAGDSRRFREAGYTQPKYMLDLDGRPLFDWTVLSFRSLFAEEQFLFVARDVQGTGDFLAQRIGALGIRQARVILLDGPTQGQADTVAIGLGRAGTADDEPLTIFNIDTIRPGYAPPTDRATIGSAGWLEVFDGEGEQWSFIEKDVDRPPFVVRTTEKERISSHCCTGLYHFAERSTFETALDRERARNHATELYIAPIYNHLIASGRDVAYRQIAPRDVLFSGVPAEYEGLKADPGRLKRVRSADGLGS